MYCDFVKTCAYETLHGIYKFFIEYIFVPVQKNYVIPFTGIYFNMLPSSYVTAPLRAIFNPLKPEIYLHNI